MVWPVTPPASRGLAARQLLPKDLRDKKGFLKSVFEFLDLPKNIVQNVVEGNLSGAGRNIADIATGITGLRLIPKLGKYLEASRPQDRPSWGFVLDILTDPLTYVGLGGAGGAAKLTKAAKASGTTRRTLMKMLSGVLTKQGRKAVSREAAEQAGRFTAKAARVAAARPGGGTARMLARLTPEVAQRAGQRRALRGMVPAVLAGAAPRQFVKQGGVQVGLPFLAGRTIAMRGKDPLKSIGKVFLPYQLLKRTGMGQKITAGVQKVLRPLAKAGPEGQRLARDYANESAFLTRQWQKRVVDTFKGLDDELAGKITQAVDAGQTDMLFKGLAKDPGRLAQAQQAVGDWQRIATEMLDEEVGIGLLGGSSIDPKRYVPLQMSDEFLEAAEAAGVEGKLGKFYDRALPGGLKTKSAYFRQRKYRNLAEFQAAGLTPELDIRKLALKRVSAHARTMANARLIRRANTLLGVGPTAGKGIPLKLRKLRDTVLQDWLTAGAGKVRIKSKALKGLAWYNRKFFKGPVTVGLGPWPNVAFITRNAVSGIFQALTDEDIGLAGFKHIPALVSGLVSKAARAAGVKYHGTVANKLALGVTKGVKMAKRSGDELLELIQKHGVAQRGFAASEFALQQMGVPATGKGLLGKAGAFLSTPKAQKWNFARQATEHTESVMRISGYLELLKKGIDPAEAAERVSKAFIDYRYQSGAERVIREVFPFAKFTLEQTPRTLEAIARRPVLTQPFRAMARLGEKEEPLPQWMRGKPVVPLPGAAPGHSTILAQFGTPLEDLEKIGTGEGFGRSFEQAAVGSLTPPLKWLYSAASGREPFYGRPMEEVNRAWNVMPDQLVRAVGGKVRELPSGRKYRTVPWEITAAFMNLPVTRQLRQVDKLLDDRMSVWVKSLNLITGAKIYDVDKDRELRRRIRDYLMQKAKDGDLGVFRRFFATGDTDQALTQLVKDYYKVGTKRK